jgi:hypothetical protein
MTDVIIAGLASSFWVNLITQSPALPKQWWYIRDHKPWGCPLCMSWWAGILMWLLLLSRHTNWFVYVSAVAMVSLLVVKILDRLELVIMK